MHNVRGGLAPLLLLNQRDEGAETFHASHAQIVRHVSKNYEINQPQSVGRNDKDEMEEALDNGRQLWRLTGVHTIAVFAKGMEEN